MRTHRGRLDDGLARIQTTQVGKTITQAFAEGSSASRLSSMANHGVIHDTAASGLNRRVAVIPTHDGHPCFNSRLGGASPWIMAGKPRVPHEAAAAFRSFIIKPEEDA